MSLCEPAALPAQLSLPGSGSGDRALQSKPLSTLHASHFTFLQTVDLPRPTEPSVHPAGPGHTVPRAGAFLNESQSLQQASDSPGVKKLESSKSWTLVWVTPWPETLLGCC